MFPTSGYDPGVTPDWSFLPFMGTLKQLVGSTVAVGLIGLVAAGAVVSMGVSRAVGMTGLPLATPHTRPTYVHHHGNRPELLPDQPDFFGRVEVPGSMSAFLELRLGQAGLDSRGLSAGIPHYVARDDYPAGAAALLTTDSTSLLTVPVPWLALILVGILLMAAAVGVLASLRPAESASRIPPVHALAQD